MVAFRDMRICLLLPILWAPLAAAAGQTPLQKAISASEAIMRLPGESGLSASEAMQLAYFIETRFPEHYQKGECYLQLGQAGLSRSVEYNSETGLRFIHLETNKIPRLGKGARKVVTKSILYDSEHPEIVARCQQTVPFGEELQIMKTLRGAHGVLQVKAVTQHKENGIQYHTMFCKLYRPGQISKLIRRLPSYRLTTNEKIKIALDLVKGLEALRKRGIVHRDLGHRNCLIHIEKGRHHRRTVEAVIADFGWGRHISQVDGLLAQGHRSYTAPEGIAFSKLLSTDYFATDLFAAGCLMYQIVYNKKPSWLHTDLVKNELPVEVRYRTHVALIQKETGRRRAWLKRRIARMVKVQAQEELESIVLQMVNPDPARRGTAVEIRRRLEKLAQ